MEGLGTLVNPSVKIFRISVDIREETSEENSKTLPFVMAFSAKLESESKYCIIPRIFEATGFASNI